MKKRHTIRKKIKDKGKRCKERRRGDNEGKKEKTLIDNERS